MSTLHIRLINSDDFPALHSHFRRHSLENGRDGDVIHAPFEAPRDIPMDVFIQGVQESSAKAVDQVGWERSWGLFEGTEIRGTIQLRHSPKLESNLHRALLAMGIERGQRGQGWGRQLMEAALSWARAQSSLEWIDLGVFEHNAPARALYSRFGFREAGRREDLFRVFKTQITDIEMVLKLR